MKQKAIHIAGTKIAPGECRYIDLALPHLYTHAQVSMPVHVIHGRKAGPRLFISGAIHGDEINGVEIIRRLLSAKMLKTLQGTLIAVPVVNPFGFISKSRYLPDRRDLNRSFPGSEGGSLAARMAHLFLEEVVSHCTHGIDLHSAAIGRTNLPQIRIELNDSAEIKGMAEAFAAPIILKTPLRDGSLRKAASERGVNMLLYEAGEALRFDEIPIRAGVRGLISVMRYLDMLPAKSKKTSLAPVFSHNSTWIRAPQSGILRAVKPMGHLVEKGETLAYVADPFGASEEIIKASTAGIIIGKTTLPLVHEGEAVFHIAQISNDKAMLKTLKNFRHEVEPELEQILE